MNRKWATISMAAALMALGRHRVDQCRLRIGSTGIAQLRLAHLVDTQVTRDLINPATKMIAVKPAPVIHHSHPAIVEQVFRGGTDMPAPQQEQEHRLPVAGI